VTRDRTALHIDGSEHLPAPRTNGNQSFALVAGHPQLLHCVAEWHCLRHTRVLRRRHPRLSGSQILFRVVADMNAAEFMPALTDMRFRAGSSRRLGFRICDGGQCAKRSNTIEQRLLHFQSPRLPDQRIAGRNELLATSSRLPPGVNAEAMFSIFRGPRLSEPTYTSNDRNSPAARTAAPARDYHASISQRRPTSGPATAARPSEVTLAGLG